MKRSVVTKSMIGLGLLALAGATAAQGYHNGTPPGQAQDGGNPPAQQQAQAPGRGSQELDTWSPWTEMRHMQAEMDRMFDNAFERMSADFTSHPWLDTNQLSGVGVSLENQPDSYVVKAEVPRVQKGNVKVSLDGRTLKIYGTSQTEEKQSGDNGQVAREESQASSFEDAFTLPGPVDASRMQTEFKDGVLTVTVPKANS